MIGKAIWTTIALSLLVYGCNNGDNGTQSGSEPSPKVAIQSSSEPQSRARLKLKSDTAIPWYLVIKRDKRNPLIGMEYNRAKRAILRRGWAPFKGECMQMLAEECVGFPELDICSAEGLCVYKFAKPNRCLIVVGIGGPPKLRQIGDAMIRSTSFQEFSCERLRSS